MARTPIIAIKQALQKARAAEIGATLTINEVEDFATEIEALGEKHACLPVTDWSKTLSDAAGMFDMDAMSDVLATYSKLIDLLTVNAG